MGVWKVIVSTEPLIRGLVAGGLVYLGVEMFKPGFAFANLGGGSYIQRGFMEDTVIDEDEDAIVSGTYFPWWALPIIAFILFGLII